MKTRDADHVDVVLELESPPEMSDSGKSQQERIAIRKETFSQKIAVIQDKIQQVGGQVLGSAWINQTIRARVPADGLPHLADLKSVERVDVPHGIDLTSVSETLPLRLPACQGRPSSASCRISASLFSTDPASLPDWPAASEQEFR